MMNQEQYKIGEGGNGKVYAYRRISDKTPVAIKVIKKRNIVSWDVIDGNSVPREITALIRVAKVENVIKLLEWHETNEDFRLILERPEECMDLFDYINHRGVIPENEAKSFLRQVVNMVQGCLDVGIIHLDIKDENVLVTNYTDGKAPILKLIDFGVVESFSKDKQTYTGFRGTFIYYPPECSQEYSQYKGIPATVWALGVLLYIMLYAALPFDEEEEPGEISFTGDVSQECRDLIRACLQVDPLKRPSSLKDILEHPWFTQNKEK